MSRRATRRSSLSRARVCGHRRWSEPGGVVADHAASVARLLGRRRGRTRGRAAELGVQLVQHDAGWMRAQRSFAFTSRIRLRYLDMSRTTAWPTAWHIGRSRRRAQDGTHGSRRSPRWQDVVGGPESPRPAARSRRCWRRAVQHPVISSKRTSPRGAVSGRRQVIHASLRSNARPTTDTEEPITEGVGSLASNRAPRSRLPFAISCLSNRAGRWCWCWR